MRGGLVIKAARKVSGWPPSMVAERYGISLNTVRNYESGRTEPPYSTVIEILEMMRVSHGEALKELEL